MVTMADITRVIEFDAAHRLVGHESKCAHLHGHRYRAEITIGPKVDLDSVGRVMDFSDIKQIAEGWINEHWDHNIILHYSDPLVRADTEIIGPRKPFIMPENLNPTVEWMAAVLYDSLRIEFSIHNHGVELLRVRLFETPNCWADYPRLTTPNDLPTVVQAIRDNQ